MESRARLSGVARVAVDVDGIAAGRDSLEPIRGLLADAVAGMAADVGWLIWHKHDPLVICLNNGPTRILLSALSDFPEPPAELLVVDGSSGTGTWARWCRDRGIGSCVVSPIFGHPDTRGTLGLVAERQGVFGPRAISRVAFVCRLLAMGPRSEKRIDEVARQFNEVSAALSGALSIPNLRREPSFQRLARAVDGILDASYFLIAVVDPDGHVSIKASGGHRPPKRHPNDRWNLGQLTRCAAALSIGRPIVVHFSDSDQSSPAERGELFSPSTRIGIILPLACEPLKGLLLIGEERASRFPPVKFERLALLEFVASRVADILSLSGFLANASTSERGRQIRLGEVAERHRLAQAVHDDVGQALTALLLRIRWAIGQSRTSTDELRVFEATAKDALEATRALAFRLRQPYSDADPIQLAREYAESLLAAVRCQLSWVDERGYAVIDPLVARAIGRVIRESVTNVARYARATAVGIRLESPDGSVRVSIRDNGSGFLPAEVKLGESGQGLGILENKESLEAIGGRFAITSSPGNGTLVVAEAPRRRNHRRP